MVLIIGGAYQGKRDYVKNAYHLTEDDIFTCNGTKIDFSRKCIDRLEEFVLACVREGIDPESYLREHEALWGDSCAVSIWQGRRPGSAGFSADWSKG